MIEVTFTGITVTIRNARDAKHAYDMLGKLLGPSPDVAEWISDRFKTRPRDNQQGYEGDTGELFDASLTHTCRRCGSRIGQVIERSADWQRRS